MDETSLQEAAAEILEQIHANAPMASLDDLVVRRDSRGELQPVEARTRHEGLRIRFLPITLGQKRAIASWNEDGKDVAEWTDEEKAAVLTENLVTPDLGIVTPERMARELHWVTADDIVATIVYESRPSRQRLALERMDAEKKSEAPSPGKPPTRSSTDTSTPRDTPTPAAAASTG